MPTVVVTCANRGIGLEFVRQYAEDGAKVIACALTQAAMKNVMHTPSSDSCKDIITGCERRF